MESQYDSSTSTSFQKGKMSKRMMKAYNLQGFSTLQQTSSSPSSPSDGKATSKIILPPSIAFQSTNDTFSPKTLEIIEPLKIGRQTSPKQPPASDNGIFDSKVLSRQHAEIYYENSKVYIKDVGSSNGTFVNGDRLSPEGVPSQGKELENGDIIDFGVDIMTDDNSEILYRRISGKVTFDHPELQMDERAPKAEPVSSALFISPGKSSENVPVPAKTPVSEAAVAILQDETKLAQEKAIELQKLSKALEEVEQLVDLKTKPIEDKSSQYQEQIDRISKRVSELESILEKKENYIADIERQRQNEKAQLENDLQKAKSSHVAVESRLAEEIATLKEASEVLKIQLEANETEIETLKSSAHEAKENALKIEELEVELAKTASSYEHSILALKAEQKAEKDHHDAEYQGLEMKLQAKTSEANELFEENDRLKQSYEQREQDAKAKQDIIEQRLKELEADLAERMKKDDKTHQETMTLSEASAHQSTMTATDQVAEAQTMTNEAEKTKTDGRKISLSVATLIAILSFVVSYLLAKQ